MRTLKSLAILAVMGLVALGCSEPVDEQVTATTIAPSTTAVSNDDGAGSTVDEQPDETVADTNDDEPDATTTTETSAPTTTEPAGPEASGEPVVDRFAGETWALGTVPATTTAADSGLDPVKIGMINQENTPLGSFPEMRAAAEAAVAFINAELGGVGGRPIELTTCITSFSVEQSQACAQEMVSEEVVALVGGIDVTSNAAIPVLEQNGIPVIGGVPATIAEQRSPVNFFFSGGGAGGVAAFMSHAADNDAKKVVLAYGEFESFEVAARDYGRAVGESLGLEVELVSFPIFATDFLPVLTTAAELDADGLIVLAADAACVPLMKGAKQLELRAQLYLVGGCAADTIVAAAGDTIDGVIFNGEGPVDDTDVEAMIYQAAVDSYATAPAGGVGTAGFRSMMNLYSILAELGPDSISSNGILDLVSAAVDRPSYWGHPYTCDGERVPGLSALCAPEQILFTIPAGGQITAASDWIETDDLFRAAIDN